MLRVLALSWLVGGVCCAASAQTVYLKQNSANNYAVIAPGDVSLDVKLRQTGQNNAAVIDQNGADNFAQVSQKATQSNISAINQFGVANTAIVAQQYNFRGVERDYPNSYVGEQTSYGYLSEFNSGGVSILALTGPGATLISTFGRSH
jgi:hypothetical protein